MPCFYCGKRVSRVRQITDADFCSDEHRRRYHALTRSAFDRLLKSGRQNAELDVYPEVERPAKRGVQAASVAQAPPTRPVLEPPAAVGGFFPLRQPRAAKGHSRAAEPVLLDLPSFVARTSEPAQETLAVNLSSSRGSFKTVEQRIPEAPMIVGRPGPLSFHCPLDAVPIGGGRALPRPNLQPLCTGGVLAPRLVEAGLLDGVGAPGALHNRAFPAASGAAEFPSNRSESRVHLQSTVSPTRGSAATGYLTLPAPQPVQPALRGTEMAEICLDTESIFRPRALRCSESRRERPRRVPWATRRPAAPGRAAVLPRGGDRQAIHILPELTASVPVFGRLTAARAAFYGYPAAAKPGLTESPARFADFSATGVEFPSGPAMSQISRVLAQWPLLPIPTVAARNDAQQWSVIGPLFGGPVSLTEFPTLHVQALAPQFAAPRPAISSELPRPAAPQQITRLAAAPVSGPASALLPSLYAATPAWALPSGLPSAQSPLPRRPQPCAARILEGSEIVASTALRLLDLPVPAARAQAGPGLQSLLGMALPEARALNARVWIAPQAPVRVATILPNSPAPAQGAHELLPLPQIQSGMSMERGEMPAWKSAMVEIAARGASLPIGIPAPARPLSLAVPAEIRKYQAPQAGGFPRMAAATVPASKQEMELPNSGAVAGAHELAGAFSRPLENRSVNREFARRIAEWQAFEPRNAESLSPATSAATSGWRQTQAARFLSGAEPAPRAGAADPLSQSAPTEFAIPAALRPGITAYAPGLGEARVTKLPPPAVRDDPKTVQWKMRSAAATRLSGRSSRLPVFHATVEKAHMPCGAFAYLQNEDRDDSRTITPGLPRAATAPGPRYPQSGCVLRFCGGLDFAELMPLSAGPCPGAAPAVISFGEFPFQPDLFVVASGIKLHRADFDAIRGSTETRWRGTLKTASGLFRGVMMFTLAIIALSLALMGCTANGGTLRQDMQSRAAVYLEQDFSQDLDGWYGARDWAKTWLRVPAGGYAVVGRLALHRPSQEYADYRARVPRPGGQPRDRLGLQGRRSPELLCDRSRCDQTWADADDGADTLPGNRGT